MGWPNAVLQLIWKKLAVENDAIVVSTAQWYNSVLSAAFDRPGMSIKFVRRSTKRVGMWCCSGGRCLIGSPAVRFESRRRPPASPF